LAGSNKISHGKRSFQDLSKATYMVSPFWCTQYLPV